MSKNPQMEKIKALNGAPKMVQQMNQKAPGPWALLGLGPGSQAGPLGPGPGPALFGSSAGPLLVLHSGH